jgi:hypothetical protein
LPRWHTDTASASTGCSGSGYENHRHRDGHVHRDGSVRPKRSGYCIADRECDRQDSALVGVNIIGIALALVLVLGPLLLGLSGLFHARRRAEPGTEPAIPWNWKQTISSALLYTLAFNLTFFIQELFLVLPKALTPGVRAKLFHSSHSWEGENPLTSLFQGTGALAIFLSGVACALLLQRRPPRSSTLRLFLIWMAYNGLFQALPQVVIGAVDPENDVGMAMHYLRLGSTARSRRCRH